MEARPSARVLRRSSAPSENANLRGRRTRTTQQPWDRMCVHSDESPGVLVYL